MLENSPGTALYLIPNWNVPGNDFFALNVLNIKTIKYDTETVLVREDGSLVVEVYCNSVTRIFTESERENDTLWSPVCWCAAFCVFSCKLPLLWLLQCVNQQKCKQDEF